MNAVKYICTVNKAGRLKKLSDGLGVFLQVGSIAQATHAVSKIPTTACVPMAHTLRTQATLA
ncbi:hypothetical protein [Neisseria animaloris]|uniref:hypothetical protein n=1 Tax=Neisseria animaloris TaxID=326522 RepID=UPI000D2FF66A|nr:hypothetical protein [Neisseria animaloris]